MVRVTTIEDHPGVRNGLKRIITQDSDCRVVAEVRDADEALQTLRKVPSDIVILDIALPKKSGLELLKQIRAGYPHLPILVLSAHSEDEYAARTRRVGASGYLTKDMAAANLIFAIRKILRGGRYVSPALAERLVPVVDKEPDRPIHEVLSDREYQILCLLSGGKTVSEIAAELSLSVKTVSTHRVRVLKKLQLKNNAELMRYSIRNKLVD